MASEYPLPRARYSGTLSQRLQARLSQGNFSFALCADTVNAVTSALSEFLPPSPVNQDDTPDRP